MNAVNVVEELGRGGIIVGEHALNQCSSAVGDRAFLTAFDAIQRVFLGVNSVVQGDKFVSDFLEQLQCLVIKFFH